MYSDIAYAKNVFKVYKNVIKTNPNIFIKVKEKVEKVLAKCGDKNE